jgi:hypothetical protein
LPANYHLTFSLAEGNDAQALDALDNGMNVAAVFAVPRGKPLPATYRLSAFPESPHAIARTVGRTFPVIDGDEHDFRPIDGRGPDGRGVIVGLRAKGDAKGDASGFVRQPL